MLTRDTTRPRYQFIHHLILGLSLTVVGMYFAGAMPAELQMAGLQIGLIGMLSFIGLPRATVTRQLNHPLVAPHVQFTPSRRVEQRLDRIMAESTTCRIDQGDSVSVSGRTRVSETSATTIRIGRNV